MGILCQMLSMESMALTCYHITIHLYLRYKLKIFNYVQKNINVAPNTAITHIIITQAHKTYKYTNDIMVISMIQKEPITTASVALFRIFIFVFIVVPHIKIKYTHYLYMKKKRFIYTK